ncbi:MAG: hypothetical protein K5906_04655 [Bacilli bacterium]|nr:hypothetical protein [Bacilli bacterium]
MRLINRSVIELEDITNNYMAKQAVVMMLGFDERYLLDYVTIHSRNAVILLYSLMNGQTRITKIVNDTLMRNDIGQQKKAGLLSASNELDTIYEKYKDKLARDRNKIQAHVDNINLLVGEYNDGSIMYIHQMKELYLAISKVYSELHLIHIGYQYVDYTINPTVDCIISNINQLEEASKMPPTHKIDEEY